MHVLVLETVTALIKHESDHSSIAMLSVLLRFWLGIQPVKN